MCGHYSTGSYAKTFLLCHRKKKSSVAILMIIAFQDFLVCFKKKKKKAFQVPLQRTEVPKKDRSWFGTSGTVNFGTSTRLEVEKNKGKHWRCQMRGSKVAWCRFSASIYPRDNRWKQATANQSHKNHRFSLGTSTTTQRLVAPTTKMAVRLLLLKLWPAGLLAGKYFRFRNNSASASSA